MVSSLILAGIGVLIVIGWVAHRFKVLKAELARKKILHKDRARRLTFIIDSLPTKYIARDLVQLIIQHIILHLEIAQQLDPASTDIGHRLEQARSIDIDQLNRTPDITELHAESIGQQLKDSRRALRILKDFILQQHRSGVLPRDAATRHVKSLHQLGIQNMLQGFASQAKYNLRLGRTSLAIHCYQLAITELRKNNKENRFSTQIEQLSQIIKDLKTQKKEKDEARVDDRNSFPLNDEWENQDGDADPWQIKNYYD